MAEILTTLAVFFFFSFLYAFGSKKEDLVLEGLGALGLLIVGLIWSSTGLQIVEINSGTYIERTITASSPIGLLVAISGFFLLLYWGKTITKVKEIG